MVTAQTRKKESLQDRPPAGPVRAQRQMPVFAGTVRQAHKVPIITRLSLKLPLHRGRLPKMEITTVAADDDPRGLGEVNVVIE